MTSAPPETGEPLRVKPLGGRYDRASVLDLRPTPRDLVKDEPGTIIWRQVLQDGTDAAVKLYRRGFAPWLRSRLTVFRAGHEFDGLRQIESLGVPCSRPLFWCHGRFAGHGWGEMLATQWVPDSRPLSDVLASGAAGDAPVDLRPVFVFAARMHDAGLRHGTLLSRNIMLRGPRSNPSFVFIDMPRFHRFRRSIRRTRMARYDLLYLCDSLAPHFQPDAVPAWLNAYGMDAADQPAFLSELKRFSNTSLLRRIIGAEFNVRYLLSRIA